ncbi:hypothetical protein [Nocardia stercoris]|uniref:hypothetical protein n=1 Tax=Nocardia stercoris TaxID=2483361 RepID=UPI0011C3B838|nr:hypothetical protein [Nocardia stercoris]
MPKIHRTARPHPFVLLSANGFHGGSADPTHVGFHLTSISGSDTPGGQVEVSAGDAGEHRDDRRTETVVSRLGRQPAVTNIGWTVPGSTRSPR